MSRNRFRLALDCLFKSLKALFSIRTFLLATVPSILVTLLVGWLMIAFIFPVIIAGYKSMLLALGASWASNSVLTVLLTSLTATETIVSGILVGLATLVFGLPLIILFSYFVIGALAPKVFSKKILLRYYTNSRNAKPLKPAAFLEALRISGLGLVKSALLIAILFPVFFVPVVNILISFITNYYMNKNILLADVSLECLSVPQFERFKITFQKEIQITNIMLCLIAVIPGSFLISPILNVLVFSELQGQLYKSDAD